MWGSALPRGETAVEPRSGLSQLQSFLVDAHSDYPVHMLLEKQQGRFDVFQSDHLPKLRAAGVRLETVTVGGDFELAGIDLRSPFVTLAILDCVHEMIRCCPNDVLLIQTAADLETLRNSPRVGLMFALEGAAPVTPDLALLRTYYRLGVRSVLLTHNERNWFADGCGEPSTGGLSGLGRDLVREMNRLHMILDVSHSNERTFYDSLEVFSGTPIASHSNARSLCDHARNLTDHQLKALAERGGVIGMNFLARFVDTDPEKATPDRLVDHVVHIASLVGIDHVGLGPDYADYYMDKLQTWAQGHNVQTIKFVTGLEDVSRLPLLTETLVSRGFSDQDTKKILCENFLRAYSANLT